jgi:glycerol kinase
MVYNTGENRIFSSRGLLTTVAYQLGPHSKPYYALEVIHGPVSWRDASPKLVS